MKRNFEITEYKQKCNYLKYVQTIEFSVENLKKAMSSINYFCINNFGNGWFCEQDYRLMPKDKCGRWIHFKHTFFYMVLYHFDLLEDDEIEFLIQNIDFDDIETYRLKYDDNLKDVCDEIKKNPYLKDKVSQTMINKLLDLHKEDRKGMIDIDSLFAN